MIKKDHPHACGDKTGIVKAVPAFTGSSPRVWGQVTHLVAPPYLDRIIPTRVGTRNDVVILSEYAEDHPHACGDKQADYPFGGYTVGSSPRVWGQAGRNTGRLIYSGIIPTRVGTSAS